MTFTMAMVASCCVIILFFKYNAQFPVELDHSHNLTDSFSVISIKII